jgi:peroxiredoxin
MATHIPDYIENADKLKAQGVDEIIAMSVNDPFVVTAFAQHLGGKDKIHYLADGNGELTKALGLEMDLSVAHLARRGMRMSMVVKNGVVTEVNNENGPGLTETSSCSTVLKQTK